MYIKVTGNFNAVRDTEILQQSSFQNRSKLHAYLNTAEWKLWHFNRKKKVKYSSNNIVATEKFIPISAES